MEVEVVWGPSGAQLMLQQPPNQRAPHIISPCHNTLPLEVEQTLTFQAFFFLAFYFKIITILPGEHLCCGEFYAAIMFHAILRQLFYHTVIPKEICSKIHLSLDQSLPGQNSLK